MAGKFIDESKAMLRLSDLTSEPKRMLPPIQGYENQPLVSLEQAVEPLISLVPDVQQMVWTVKQNCENPEENLTSDESGSIMLYTLEWEPREAAFYFILNSKLRTENRQNLRPWFLFLRLIIFALAKLPSISSRIVYRGIQFDMSKDYLKDKTFIWWSFSSCTSIIEVIQHFLGQNGPRTILNIESNSAKDISRHSFYKSENEILLFPARQFQIISSLNPANELHIIHLKEIQPPFPLIHIPQINPPTILDTCISQSYQNQKLKDLIDKCQHHSKIDLSCQNLSDEDMNIVVKEAIIKKQCKELLLNSNQITSAGASIVSTALNGNTILQVLQLSFNKVGDTGVHHLTKTLSLNNSSLRELHLDWNKITDEGAGYLAEMLKTNSTLFCLSIYCNNIGDRGTELLIRTLRHYNNTLQKINMNGNKSVSDSSIDSLVELLKLDRSLSILYIFNCNLSEQGKERLRQITKTKKGFNLCA